MSRKIVIINRYDNKDNVLSFIDKIAEFGAADHITVYSNTETPEYSFTRTGFTCVNEVIPPEFDSEPKIRNWICSANAGFDGFLHIVSDSVELMNDPRPFLVDLENMMAVLDYPVWFSTVTDGCNYVYSKYNPRIRIMCDRLECASLGLTGELCFTSHSNTQWTCYDMPKLAGSDLLRLDERFTVPMFFIIEFLARRRNTKPANSLFFMNQYMTVKSELGTFRNLPGSGSNDDTPPDTMKSEDAVFKSMNIDYHPDNDVDTVLETLWEKILSKRPSAS